MTNRMSLLVDLPPGYDERTVITGFRDMVIVVHPDQPPFLVTPQGLIRPLGIIGAPERLHERLDTEAKATKEAKR